MNLLDYLADPVLRAKLPAGMRNSNPGNIKYTSTRAFPGVVGPSVNTDQGDPQAVFNSPEAGMAAMFNLAKRKYQGGKTTPNALIAGNMGWTPGNYQAAANVARTMGIGPDDDIGMNDPASAAKFMRALIRQEHGQAGDLYTDDMISSAISGAGLPSASTGSPPAMAYNESPRRSPAMNAIDQQTTGSTQPAMASAAPEQKKRSGLFGGLIGEGGLIDPTSEQFLLAATLISNGMKPPGQMMDGVPEALLLGRRMSDAREQKAKDEKVLNATTQWLRERDPDLANLVENKIMTGGDAVTQFYNRQKDAKEEQTWRDRVKYEAEVQQSDPKYQLDLQAARTAADEKNQTKKWFRENEPEIGTLVDAGMPMGDAMKLLYDKRNPKPDRQWVQLQNGDFGWADKKSGQFEKLGNAPKVGGDSGAELPAEMGARIGLGDKFLAQVPEIRERIKAGDASGLWDKTMLATGSGGAGQLWRQIETGRDALVRNLTGAGMPESEAQNQAARYQIGVTDSVETMLDKLTNLEADLRATRAGAIGAKTGQLSLTPAPGSGTDPAGALEEARTAIAKGAPREAIIQRLTQMGISPEGL